MKWQNMAKRAVAIGLISAALWKVEAAPGPIRVSQNGPYFVDAQGAPF